MAEPTHTDEEDYEAAAHSTADYADYQQPQKPRNPMWGKLGKALTIGLIAIIVIATLGAGGYWLSKHHKSSPKPEQQSQSNQPTSVTKIESKTKHYDSTNFNLGFDYPADWTVKDDVDGLLTVKSPATSLKGTDGQSISAQITMSIRRNDQKLSEFDAGNATAVIDSEKIAYTKPTQTQRANTYISFLKYANSTGGFNGIYITGDNGYQKSQAIPKVDIQKVDPIVSVTFSKCSGGQCSNTPLSISIDNWSDQNFKQPIESMLQSLQIF